MGYLLCFGVILLLINYAKADDNSRADNANEDPLADAIRLYFCYVGCQDGGNAREDIADSKCCSNNTYRKEVLIGYINSGEGT